MKKPLTAVFLGVLVFIIGTTGIAECTELDLECEKQITATVVHAAATGLGGVLNNVLEEKNRIELIHKFIAPIRFYKDNSGYFYAYDLNCVCIAHATQFELPDKNLFNYQDSKGKYVIQELKQTAEKGGGFVEYYWQNPLTKKEQKKIGYVEMIPGTDYFIGSGVYPGQKHDLPVGILLPFSGQYSWIEKEVFSVIEMITQKINNEGGILGSKITLIKGDTRGEGDVAAIVSKKLIKDNEIIAFIGPTSLSFFALKEIIQKNKIPMISPTAGTTELDKADKKYFYRTVPSDSLGGSVIARAITAPSKFMKHPNKFTSIVLMVSDIPAMTSFKQPIEKGINQFGYSLKDIILYETGKKSYELEIQKALNNKPGIIILVDTPDDSVLILKEAKKMGYEGSWFLTQDQTNADFIQLAGPDLLKNIYGFKETSPPETISHKEALAKQLKDYCGEKIGIFGANTYDASNILFLAMLRAKIQEGTVNSQTIAQNIRLIANQGPNKVEVTNFIEGKKMLLAGKEINYQGLDGPMDFDEYGNVITPYSIQHLKNGSWVEVGVIGMNNLGED